MNHLTIPIVHLNGTSAEELIRVRDEAYLALNTALEALKAMAPNGRDYYLEPGKFDRAVEQHMGRQRVLVCLMNDIEQEMDAIEAEKARR